MADLLTRGHVDGGSAVVAGEVVVGLEPGHVCDLGEDPPGDDRADPVQVGQAGAVVFDHAGDLCGDRLEVAIQGS